MRNAYALLGLSFLVVFVGAYLLINRADAPTQLEVNQSETMSLSLSSDAFADGARIPAKYTCDGENINPSLKISNIPEGTKSFVLVMDDPDIPQAIKESRGIEKFNHWVLYNIPSDVTAIGEGAAVGSAGQNSAGDTTYRGPCPPPDMEPPEHRYVFRLYALPNELNFVKTPTLDEVETAAMSSATESAVLTGLYRRN